MRENERDAEPRAPLTLENLIIMASEDARAIADMETVQGVELHATAGEWIQTRQDVDGKPRCEVCWAGMMMIRQCGADPNEREGWDPDDFPDEWERCFLALETLRTCEWSEAAGWMHHDSYPTEPYPVAIAEFAKEIRAKLGDEGAKRIATACEFDSWAELKEFLAIVREELLPIVAATERAVYPNHVRSSNESGPRRAIWRSWTRDAQGTQIYNPPHLGG